VEKTNERHAKRTTIFVPNTVAFDGKSVPAGKLILLPDTSKGNSGQGGFADIKDGVYDTSKNGQGILGGPTIVRLDGFDGLTTANDPIGKRLFMTHEFLVDLPRQNSTKDFDVPASAAKNLPKGTGDPP